jgi:hypothetical protein
LALKRSRSSAVMAAHNMPPSTPAIRMATTMARGESGVACIATPPAKIAPRMYWPSAPMFQTLARKHSARPSAIRISGVALTPISLHA